VAERYADHRARAGADPAARSLTAWLAGGVDEAALWAAAAPGPSVAELTARVSALPREFLRPEVDLTALCGDVLAPEHEVLPPVLAAAVAEIREHGGPAAATGAAVGLWLYASEGLLGPLSVPLARAWAPRVVLTLALRQAAVVRPYDWVVDAERREETVRAVLLFGAQRPAGERLDAARSRWAAVDSVRRDEALRATLADYAHRQEVMRRLAEQRAREAAARYTNE
jgi:hypothetical protein